MADDDSSQEKTEEATPRKREKAREEGQIPRSKELTTTAVLLLGTIGLYVFGQGIGKTLLGIMELNFSIDRAEIFDENLMFSFLGESMANAIFSLLPLFAVILLAAIVGPISLGGWLFSAKSLAPKFNRLDPIKGLGRMFSMKSLIELLKSIGKICIVLFVAYLILMVNKSTLLSLSRESLEQGIVHAVELSIWAAIILAASTIIIVFIDIPFQIHDNSKKLKMSKQDVKDEMKDTEGKPEVKSKIRQRQMEMAQRRMMASVPEADVVITNPTHFSIALKYNPETMDTPILLAKGVDVIALKIREIAKENSIEMIESPLLARAIYHTTELDEAIPHSLYLAVAQVLAYVFQLREFRKGRGDRPVYPKNLDIPKDMQDY